MVSTPEGSSRPLPHQRSEVEFTQIKSGVCKRWSSLLHYSLPTGSKKPSRTYAFHASLVLSILSSKHEIELPWSRLCLYQEGIQVEFTPHHTDEREAPQTHLNTFMIVLILKMLLSLIWLNALPWELMHLWDNVSGTLVGALWSKSWWSLSPFKMASSQKRGGDTTGLKESSEMLVCASYGVHPCSTS